MSKRENAVTNRVGGSKDGGGGGRLAWIDHTRHRWAIRKENVPRCTEFHSDDDGDGVEDLECSTEQRLSVALGGKSASSTPKLRRAQIAAHSKESSGSHEFSSSTEGVNHQKDVQSPAHLGRLIRVGMQSFYN